ncbi:MAG: ceramide glucosyltransferase [Bdellovibrionota bacterium]
MLLFSWWILCLIFFSLGSLAVIARARRSSGIACEFPPVTILKPLKGHEDGLMRNLESFFLLDYPQYELLFSIADPADPARLVVEALRKKYPVVNARLLIGDELALNPKVGNLIRSYEQAKNDLMLISDSNVRVSCSYLKSLVSQMDKDVGVLTATVGGIGAKGGGGELESVYLNTFYSRGLALAFLFGKPCVIGKSMMFRKSVAEKFGGLKSLSMYLAEDYVIGERMRELGLKVKLMREPVSQYIGRYTFSSFWSRHLRWGRIRKVHAPLAFLLEPIFMPAFAAVAGASSVASHCKGSFLALYLVMLGIFCALDLVVAANTGGKQKLKFIWWWLIRECLSFPMWLAIASSNRVNWRGRSISLQFGGTIREEDLRWLLQTQARSFSGVSQPARIKLRDTIEIVTGGDGNALGMLPEA